MGLFDRFTNAQKSTQSAATTIPSNTVMVGATAGDERLVPADMITEDMTINDLINVARELLEGDLSNVTVVKVIDSSGNVRPESDRNAKVILGNKYKFLFTSERKGA